MKNTFTIKETTYFTIDYGNLRFAIPVDNVENIPTTKKELQKKWATDDKSFAVVQQTCAKQIIDMGLAIKPLRFCFFIRPDVHGISGAPQVFNQHTLDKNYPKALQVGLSSFEYGYNTTATERSPRRQAASIHELAHVLHGGYFDVKLGGFYEGFAEMIPYYLLGFEEKDQKHQNAILNLKEEDILNLKFFDKFHHFSLGGWAEKTDVQDLRTYQSMYLWMMGYIKRVQDKYGYDKYKATEFILKKFATVSKISDTEKRMKLLAQFISTKDNPISIIDLTTGKMLQLEGQAFIKDYYHLQRDENIKIVNCNTNTILIRNTPFLNQLGYFGKLFQKSVSLYLKKENALSPTEQTLIDYIENIRKQFDLTHKDTVTAVCLSLASIAYKSPNDTTTQIERVAQLFDIDKTKIKELWHQPTTQKDRTSDFSR